MTDHPTPAPRGDDDREVRARRALLVVDVQNDFCEGGALAVAGGGAVAEGIARLLGGRHPYDVVVATRDHHVDPGAHFAGVDGAPDFRTTWPAHCVAGTPGAALHPALPRGAFDAIFDKGAFTAAYSGFEGTLAGADVRDVPLSLAAWLRERQVANVDIVGLATDHCVVATAVDAVEAGFATTVLLDLCAGVAPDTTATALDRLRGAGVAIRPGAPAGEAPVGAGPPARGAGSPP